MTERGFSVLFVEDDERLARLTAAYLEGHGVRVTHTGDGAQVLRLFRAATPDVVLLDVMLPGLDGLAVCRGLRAISHVPIVMLTARDHEFDRVQGLEAGADDYVLKPFSSPELLARLRAQVRRARGEAGPASRGTLEFGQLMVDPDARRVTLAGVVLPLTTYEFSLLLAFAERAGRVLSREQLMELVRGAPDEAFDRSIDVHISHLRAKLGDDPRSPTWLKTIRGVGYLFAGADA
jgi:DNA-binding response OmpR family regulator